MKETYTFFQRILQLYHYKKKGIPFYLLSLSLKNRGIIENGKLYRRSKKHPPEDHWNETRLGEISTNWNRYCKDPYYVLYNVSSDKPLVLPEYKRVIICNLDAYNDNSSESYPFAKILKDEKGQLEIRVEHAPLAYNYSHSNVNCYLTTIDNQYNNSRVPHDGYDKHPLKKNLRGLRNKYKAHLMYHFNNYLDFD